jgi:hypothetical protein
MLAQETREQHLLGKVEHLVAGSADVPVRIEREARKSEYRRQLSALRRGADGTSALPASRRLLSPKVLSNAPF